MEGRSPFPLRGKVRMGESPARVEPRRRTRLIFVVPSCKRDWLCFPSPAVREELGWRHSDAGKGPVVPSDWTQRARQLRYDSTDAERHLWRRLRLRQADGLKFRRQYPIGKFIVDFVCIERGLVVEIDGGQHGSEQAIYDAERDAWLQRKGYQVLRFWNNEVLLEVESVLEVIRRSLAGAPPSRPSP